MAIQCDLILSFLIPLTVVDSPPLSRLPITTCRFTLQREVELCKPSLNSSISGLPAINALQDSTRNSSLAREESAGNNGMIDFMNERKLMDLLNSSEYVPSYEDKDGD